MKRAQQGFTLIELMIVVAIIGILAAIAVPAFQKNVEKSKFAEALSISDGYQKHVAVCASTSGISGCNAGSGDIPELPATKPDNVDTWSVAAGVVKVKMKKPALESVMTPTLDNGILTWAQSGSCSTAIPKMC